MNSGQEGNEGTKIRIHTVICPKFCESEINFFLFPLVLQSSVHVQSTIIPKKKSNSFIFHILNGFHDRSILAKDIRGVKSYTCCE